MDITYFLGANSARGFYSLYESFCRGEGDYLHIIKGGPGTGKSGFMKKLAAAAAAKGYAVEYTLCSGDPDSLDGIYIPKLRQGWVDGTAPHVMEPVRFGVDSDYVNLGALCAVPLKAKNHPEIKRIYKAYKDKYEIAYSYLKSAAQLRRAAASASGRFDEAAFTAGLMRLLPDSDGKGSIAPVRRFFHALSCKGEIYLNEQIIKLCKQYYVVSGALAHCERGMEIIASLCRDQRCIISPDPLEPEKTEAVLLPEAGIAFVREGFKLPDGKRLQLSTEDKHSGEALELGEKMKRLAIGRLKEAKALHDELEAYYISAMDYDALDKFTEGYIRSLFG